MSRSKEEAEVSKALSNAPAAPVRRWGKVSRQSTGKNTKKTYPDKLSHFNCLAVKPGFCGEPRTPVVQAGQSDKYRLARVDHTKDRGQSMIGGDDSSHLHVTHHRLIAA